ncbi:MAG: KH domain-containing protein [Leptolyngbya sp. IPPAS B-1204]
MPDLNVSLSSQPSTTAPDYEGLVRFLVQPFLDSPDSLRIDCEISPRTMRVLVRLAIEGEDKGRVFGRGGRNIQAVRTVLQAVAQAAGHSAHLEVFGSQASGPTPREHGSDDRPMRSRSPRRPSRRS